MIELQVQKPGETDSAFVTMWTYDADASEEGELSINGNAPLPLFGPQAQTEFTKTTAPITYVLSSAIFRDGLNRMLFAHTTSRGFRIDSLGVVFRGVTEVDPGMSIPAATSLEQNYPNPFNPSTVISFALASGSHVELAVFNILGERIATLIDGPLAPGHHSARFSPAQLSGGVYFYVLRAGDFQETRRMAYVK